MKRRLLLAALSGAVLFSLRPVMAILPSELNSPQKSPGRDEKKGTAQRGGDESDLPRIQWDDAWGYVGHRVEVEGIIRSTRIVSGSGKSRHVWFFFAPPERNALTLKILPQSYGRFPSRPELLYRGRKVRVRGKITASRGRPWITLLGPSQIRRIDTKGDGGDAPRAEGTSDEVSLDQPGRPGDSPVSGQGGPDRVADPR